MHRTGRVLAIAERASPPPCSLVCSRSDCWDGLSASEDGSVSLVKTQARETGELGSVPGSAADSVWGFRQVT